MIQSIVQSYDYKKKIGKGGGGEGTTVVANPTGPAQAWLDKIKIGDDIFQTKQVPRTLDEDKVLISDPNQETGTKWESAKNLDIDLSCIADDYDETKNPANRLAYNLGSYVIYNHNLYKARFSIYTKAGAFNPDMWDIVTTYDAQETYAIGDACIYNGDPYKCTSEDGATGEWDSSKWTQQHPMSYNISFSNYYPGNMVEYAGNYYVANATYENNPVGPFDATRWSKTQVSSNLTATISQYTYSSASGETKTSQVSIPVSGVAPTNVFRATISMNNDAGEECQTSCNFKAGSEFLGGSSGKCVLVIPGYASVKFLVLTVSLGSSGTNRILIELNRITEIGLVEGSLSITTDTEMIFPPITVRLESLTPNVITQIN